VKRKNIGRLDMPPVFSNEGGRRVCSNLWAAAMMRRLARDARAFAGTGTRRHSTVKQGLDGYI